MHCVQCHSAAFVQDDAGYYVCRDCGTRNREVGELETREEIHSFRGQTRRAALQAVSNIYLEDADLAMLPPPPRTSTHDTSVLVLRAFQMMLKQHTDALVRELGVSLHVPPLVRELWERYLRKSVRGPTIAEMRATPHVNKSKSRGGGNEKSAVPLAPATPAPARASSRTHSQLSAFMTPRAPPRVLAASAPFSPSPFVAASPFAVAASPFGGGPSPFLPSSQRTRSVFAAGDVLPSLSQASQERAADLAGLISSQADERAAGDADSTKDAYKDVCLSPAMPLALVLLACLLADEPVTVMDLLTLAKAGVLPLLDLESSVVSHLDLDTLLLHREIPSFLRVAHHRLPSAPRITALLGRVSSFLGARPATPCLYALCDRLTFQLGARAVRGTVHALVHKLAQRTHAAERTLYLGPGSVQLTVAALLFIAFKLHFDVDDAPACAALQRWLDAIATRALRVNERGVHFVRMRNGVAGNEVTPFIPWTPAELDLASPAERDVLAARVHALVRFSRPRLRRSDMRRHSAVFRALSRHGPATARHRAHVREQHANLLDGIPRRSNVRVYATARGNRTEQHRMLACVARVLAAAVGVSQARLEYLVQSAEARIFFKPAKLAPRAPVGKRKGRKGVA